MTPTVTCPSCGRSVDPLRAGNVAILNGGFHYFCDESCKRSFVRGSLAPPPSEVETAEPPGVAVGRESADGANRPTESVVDPAPAAPTPIPPLAVTAPATTPPSPPPATVSGRFGSRPRLYIQHVVSSVGVGAGFLAAGLALLGPGAQSARFGLATLSLVACSARAVAAPHDPSDVHPVAALLSVAAVWFVAFYARGVGDPQAVEIASVAGLTGAAHLVSATLVDRAREGVRSARDWIRQRLDVPVRVVRGERASSVAPDDVKPGEIIEALPGDTLGVDARLASGEAVVTPWIDAAVEVTKGEGARVVAGARVVSGSFRAVTTWSGPDRAWLKLAVARGQGTDVLGTLSRRVRLTTERGALVAATLIAALGMVNGAGGVDALAMAAVAAFSLAGCGVAGIVALHQARGPLSALAQGVVYRDAASFDAAGHTDVAVLCLRGTLLKGAPEIVAIETLSSLAKDRILGLAAGAGASSAHPADVALREAAGRENEPLEGVRHATQHPGLGVTALAASGERLVVGSRALLLREKISIAIADARVTELEGEGRSVTLVALGDRLVGLVALQDGLRPGARAAVQRLLDAGVEPVLLSGEARETCEAIGRALDVEHIRPEVLPHDRGAEVRALAEGGHVVAVLGHPEEDDGALGAAQVSVALADAGGTPGEWSIALASDDVRDAARAISIAGETRRRTRVAILLGFAPGVMVVVGVGLGVLPLAAAPLASLAGLAAAVVHARR